VATALEFRNAGSADLHFVEETFLDSFRLAHAAGLIGMGAWRDVMTREWRRLRDRQGVSCVVAHHPGAQDPRADLYGWAAVENSAPVPFLHFAYVKLPYRRMGIGGGLLLACGITPATSFDYAAKTAVCSRMVQRYPGATWNPLRARFEPKE
jgi:hypothetical protein